MNKLFLASLVFLFTNSFVANAARIVGSQIIKTKQVTDALQYAKPGSLFLWDIDNTLATTPGVVGSDQWFSHMVSQKIAEGFDPIHSINSVLPTYFMAQFHIDLELVDDESLQVLKKLEDQGISFACLTARSLHLADRTLEQLDRINLKMNSPTDIAEKYLTLAHPSLYKHGVLFSGLNDKGVVLFSWLDSIGLRPESIIFIDDKMSNIRTVEEAVSGREIPFVGVHYTHEEDKVKNYDPAQAEKELAAFLGSRKKA